MCEGDDYWTDPHKLQKQVDFLEDNPSFSICSHKYGVLMDGIIRTRNYSPPESITINEYSKALYNIQTATVLFKKFEDLFTPLMRYTDKVTGSYFLFLLLAERGNMRFMNEEMSVYRKHEGGIWSGKDKFEQGSMELKNKRAMLEYFSGNKSIWDNIRKAFIKKLFFTEIIF